ncbi:MAG: hypothetical protein ABI726_08645 [bacterium]
MGSTLALQGDRGEGPAIRSRAELRELLDRTLQAVDSDDFAGPLLRGVGLSVRFEIPNLDLVLNVAPSVDPDHHLRWEFADDRSFDPKLELTMDSEVANAYLQGRESLAIGIARRHVRFDGRANAALLYVPALRLVCEHYRRIVNASHPDRAAAAGR